ncbi:MAG: hypothetical protein KQI81_08915 [Deltaproteobacteria bacterium]|nr:hypothetical protein [Deltaproteobacteria bacterium]
MIYLSRNPIFFHPDGSKLRYRRTVEFYDKFTGKPSHWRHELQHLEAGYYVNEWATCYKAVKDTKTFPFTPDNLIRYRVER